MKFKFSYIAAIMAVFSAISALSSTGKVSVRMYLMAGLFTVLTLIFRANENRKR